jgi:GNAT superfamily N-acetyltransferase
MPLQVLPLTDSDTEEWADLYYPAFSQSNVRCLWYKEPSPESLLQFADALREALKIPTCHIFKCVDTDLDDKIIAVAKWSVFDKRRSMEDVEKTFEVRRTFAEENGPARAEFMKGLWKSRRQVMEGNPHVMLDSLLCHPDHHRRGAGRMLMQWGLNKADELGLPGYLEGSAAGVGLYAKVGFEPVRQILFDGTKYGAKAPDVHTVSCAHPFSTRTFRVLM